MTNLSLHVQAIIDADDVAMTRAVSACIAEIRRRALLSQGYHVVSTTLAANACKNAAMKASGLEHNGFDPKDEV